MINSIPAVIKLKDTDGQTRFVFMTATWNKEGKALLADISHVEEFAKDKLAYFEIGTIDFNKAMEKANEVLIECIKQGKQIEISIEPYHTWIQETDILWTYTLPEGVMYINLWDDGRYLYSYEATEDDVLRLEFGFTLEEAKAGAEDFYFNCRKKRNG